MTPLPVAQDRELELSRFWVGNGPVLERSQSFNLSNIFFSKQIKVGSYSWEITLQRKKYRHLFLFGEEGPQSINLSPNINECSSTLSFRNYCFWHLSWTGHITSKISKSQDTSYQGHFHWWAVRVKTQHQGHISRCLAVDVKRKQRIDGKAKLSEKWLVFVPLTLKELKTLKRMSKDQSFWGHIFVFIDLYIGGLLDAC